MYYLLFLNLIVPFVMILVGDILKKHPVSDMSKHNGYNTPTSRKSQEHWEYAQSIAPHIFMFIGKILGVEEDKYIRIINFSLTERLRARMNLNLTRR